MRSPSKVWLPKLRIFAVIFVHVRHKCQATCSPCVLCELRPFVAYMLYPHSLQRAPSPTARFTVVTQFLAREVL
jgi:hypothetical protein